MNQVINIRDQSIWNFLVTLKSYLKVAEEYDIPMDKEDKEYREYLSKLVA